MSIEKLEEITIDFKNENFETRIDMVNFVSNKLKDQLGDQRNSNISVRLARYIPKECVIYNVEKLSGRKGKE